MLSLEVAHFYGIVDPHEREHAVGFLNTMLMISDSRRGALETFFRGVAQQMETSKRIQAQVAEDRTKMDNLKVALEKQTKLTARLETINKNLADKNQKMTAEHSQMALACAASIETVKRDLERVTHENKLLLEAKEQLDIALPEGTQSGASIYMNQNTRLRKCVADLTAVGEKRAPAGDRPPGRMTKEHAKLQSEFEIVQAKLLVLGELVSGWFGADAANALKADPLEQLQVEREARVALENEVEALKKAEPPSKRRRAEENMVRILQLSDGKYMACPVPVRSGCIVELHEVYRQWSSVPPQDDGSFNATFRCPITNFLTALQPMEIVNMVHDIASDLKLDVAPPFRFQFKKEDAWVDFPFTDQIAIASKCFMLYRSGFENGVGRVLVRDEAFSVIMRLNQSSMEIVMTLLAGKEDATPVLFVPGPEPVFERWKFVAH